MRDPFPAWLGKNSRRSRCISRGRRLHRKGKRNSRAAPPFRVPQISQFISEEPVFPALPRLSRRGSTATTVAREAALWESLVESLVGKPRGKATDPLIHGTGSVTLQLQLWRKAHVHAPIQDEDLLPWGDSRSTPRSMSALERKPHVPGTTPHKVLGSGIEGRGIPRGSRATRMRTDQS